MQDDRLRYYQVPSYRSLAAILRQHNSAIDFSDCGTGKTYVAAAVAKTLALPTLVVGPKIAETQWQRAAEYFEDEIDYLGYEKLRTGKTQFGRWEFPLDPSEEREFLQCENCQQRVEKQPCYCHPAGIHCVVVKKKSHNYGKFIFDPAIKFLIFDECHRCGALDSLNADMLIAARRQKIKTLGLSATPACNPLQMRALGYLLDLHSLDHDLLLPGEGRRRGFYSWAAQHGCRKDPRFHGLKWFASAADQIKIMAAIRDQIIPARGVRVTTEAIPDFPKCQIEAELYDLEEYDKINKLYEQMAEALAALETAKQFDACPEHPLTTMLRARQQLELLKIPLAVELFKDYQAKGYSVAIFVNFSQTISELSTRLDCDCIIDGSAKRKKTRQGCLDAFNSNRERGIIINSDAGGASVSLHDLHGGFPRAGLVMPGFSAVGFRQLAGRLARDGGKSPALYRVLLAAKTVETQILRALRGKLNNLDALTDADLQPDNLRIYARH